MTENGGQEGTESKVPQGKYERKKQEELQGKQVEGRKEQFTDEGTVCGGARRKVRIEESSLVNRNSVSVRVDVESDERKAGIARLNERLRRLKEMD